MIKYKHILEAVNNGIKFALSNLEDDEELSSIGKQKQSQIVNNNSTKDLINLKKELVDLGLPSGTLWFNYNYGVDYKKVFEYNKPEDFYGLYLSWGEKNIK